MSGPATLRKSEREAPGVLTWLAVAGLVFLLLAGVGVIGEGFKWVSGGKEGAAAIFAFASNPLVGVILGILATAMVQSSSTVTSVIVGLVAGGVPVSTAVPMIMGANIGACITALLAATSVAGENQVFALQIAIVHLMYNLFGVIAFFVIPWLKHTPINSARWLGDRAEQNRGWAFAYIFLVFFVVPGLVLYGQKLFEDPDAAISAAEAAAIREAQEELEDAGLTIE